MKGDLISVIVFGLCVVLYILNKYPKTLIAIAGLIVMLLLNIVSFNDAFKNFAGKTSIIAFSTMIIGQAIIQTGIAHSISKIIFRLANNDERRIIIISILITAVLSSFIDGIAVCIIIYSILVHICKNNKTIHFSNIALPVGIASVFSTTLFFIGGTTLPTASGILETYIGQKFYFFTTTSISLILNIILVLYVGFIGYPLGKRIWGKRDEYIKEPKINQADIIISKKKYIMIVILIITLIAFVLSDKIATVLPNVNIATISLISALLCIITGCISYKDAIQSINWDILIWLGATLAVVTGLINSGGGQLIANSIINIVGNSISPLLLYTIFIIFTIFLTQFMSNTGTASLILPIMCATAIKMGFNTYSFAIGITLACSFGILTPLANGTMALVYTANYKFSDFIKYCLPLVVCEIIALIIFVPILYPLA